MLQHSAPDDFVIATGQTQSVQHFLQVVFEMLELAPNECVSIDSRYFRPAELNLLLGDASKARYILGWSPPTNLSELARLMVESDLKLARS